MTIEKINGHEYASVKIIKYDNGAEALVSYSTTVITIDAEGWITINGLYSRTTIKHIGWFMREHGFTYQLAKQLYQDDKTMNIFTGEVRENH